MWLWLYYSSRSRLTTLDLRQYIIRRIPSNANSIQSILEQARHSCNISTNGNDPLGSDFRFNCCNSKLHWPSHVQIFPRFRRGCILCKLCTCPFLPSLLILHSPDVYTTFHVGIPVKNWVYVQHSYILDHWLAERSLGSSPQESPEVWMEWEDFSLGDGFSSLRVLSQWLLLLLDTSSFPTFREPLLG